MAQSHVTGLLGVCMANPICKSFETWGFTDKYTDLGSWQYPLPFDQSYGFVSCHFCSVVFIPSLICEFFVFCSHLMSRYAPKQAVYLMVQNLTHGLAQRQVQ
jgi:hypothetical protein